jgi:hypothetical protein
MSSKVDELLKQIQALEAQAEDEIRAAKAQFKSELTKKKALFDKEVLAQQRRYKEGLLRYILTINLRCLLSVPFIYAVLVPLLLLDVFTTIYQWVCFPLYRIPRVKRSDYFVYDRNHLAYLNLMEKLNCAYCSYANGFAAYFREIVGRTEQYWCPIKHAQKILQAHAHYQNFTEFGAAQQYREQLDALREKLSKLQ